ncbi:SCO3242 family prenyltransferase [Actinocrinis sp.]|jgi:4-hydroxybenzoate polyprenyltransferase|uniref:SCO3242 family prenyltransferase n=1 Tax=Actinocrinis sp. TaxID=1920516 RepID=UPI0032C23DFF
MTTCGDLAELVRAPAALSVPGDALVGAAATGDLSTRAVTRTAGLAAASVCLYWAGMAANDWADRDLDAAERPHRPIPSGRVRPGDAFGLAVGLTAAGCVLAGFSGGRSAAATASVLAGTVWAYDVALKGTVVGPAAMAACRGLDVLLGASAGRMRRAALPALTIAAHTYTVTALSRYEVHGASRGLPAATLIATAAVTTLATAPARGQSSRRLLTGAFAAGYAALYGAPQLRAAAEPSAANVRRAVGAGITSLPALQGTLAAGLGMPGAAAALALAAAVGRRLAARTAVT